MTKSITLINAEDRKSSVLVRNEQILHRSCDLIRHYVRYKRYTSDNRFQKSIDTYQSLLKGMMNTKGVSYAVKWNKALRLDTLRYLAGEPLPITEQRDIWFRRQRSTGLPTCLGPDMISLIKELKPEGVRLILSLLYIPRWFKITSEPDYSTIEEGSDKGCPKALSDFVDRSFPDPLLSREDLEPYYPHLSTSMGPNGPATLTATDDLLLLDDDLKSDLFYLANDQEGWLQRYFTHAEDPSQVTVLGKAKKTNSGYVRRLHEIDDKEGKKRIIAIFDYWSQGVLKPLHHALAGILRRWENDCTFNQSNFKSILTDPRAAGQPIHSVDLKAATDKMPASLQAQVLGRIMGDEEYGDAWLRVMVEREFQCPDGKTRAYAQGQPMGAYSSWAIMAITHHIIIRFAFYLVRKDPVYYVLGDDALIVGDDAWKAYLAVCRSLQMEVSLSKTFRSLRFFEFAKRYFLNGVEVTPFPIDAVLSSKGEASLMAVGIDNAITKSVLTLEEVYDTRIIGFFADCFTVFGSERGSCHAPARKLRKALLAMDLIRWVEHDGLTARPYGLRLFGSSCSRSDTWLREKFRYCYSQALGELAGELYQQSMSSYQLIEQHLYEYESLFQLSSDATEELVIMAPIWQVTQKKLNLLAEIANLQYDFSKPVSELVSQWGGYLDELSFVLPDWDTFDNRKGSSKRARARYQVIDKVYSFVDKWYNGIV